MSRLQELRQKYRLEGGKHEPNPDCKFCKGTGEKIVRSTGELTFCICLFISPDFSNEMGDMLGNAARKLKDEISAMAAEVAKRMQELKTRTLRK